MIRQCKLYILIQEILACRPIYIHIQLFSLKLNYPSYKLNTLNWGTYWEIINVIIIKFIVAIYCQFLIDYTWGNDVCIKLWEASHADFKAILGRWSVLWTEWNDGFIQFVYIFRQYSHSLYFLQQKCVQSCCSKL